MGQIGSESAVGGTMVERKSDRELVVTRTFDAPPRIVFEAWTTPALFMQWWAPKSIGVKLLSCDMDVRTGGGYRVTFGDDPETAMAFFGKYLEVVLNERLVWTNEEGDEGAITTVTFQEQDGKTLLMFDASYVGMEGGMTEQFGQLDELLASRGA
jgi:uncharacterized protein YndB with AHSA1/START domain